MAKRTYTFITVLYWLTSCSASLNQTQCFLNKSLTWDSTAAECIVNPSDCTQRLDTLSCLRDGLCWWVDNSQTCLTRSVPSSLIATDTACRAYFNYTDIIFSGETCMQDSRCEFDAYSMNCIVNRALTCPLYTTQSACDIDLQCMYAVASDACVPFSYDYNALCYGFSCDPRSCALDNGVCSVGKQGTKELLAGPIALFCRTNTIHPFNYPCSNVTECVEVCTDALHSPYCKLALDVNIIDLCVPHFELTTFDEANWNQRYNEDNIVLIPGLVLMCLLFACIIWQISRPVKVTVVSKLK